MDGLDVKLARIRYRIPQYRAAAALGIPAPTLSKIENGQRRVAPERLVAIAAKLEELARTTGDDGRPGDVRDVGV
jgi:transcriptional regulator with XRE-family HTH domain